MEKERKGVNSCLKKRVIGFLQVTSNEIPTDFIGLLRLSILACSFSGLQHSSSPRCASSMRWGTFGAALFCSLSLAHDCRAHRWSEPGISNSDAFVPCSEVGESRGNPCVPREGEHTPPRPPAPPGAGPMPWGCCLGRDTPGTHQDSRTPVHITSSSDPWSCTEVELRSVTLVVTSREMIPSPCPKFSGYKFRQCLTT